MEHANQEPVPREISIDALWLGYARSLIGTIFGSNEYSFFKQRYVISMLAKMETEIPLDVTFISDKEMASRLNELAVEGFKGVSVLDHRMQGDLQAAPSQWRTYIHQDIYAKITDKCPELKNFQDLLYGLEDHSAWLAT